MANSADPTALPPDTRPPGVPSPPQAPSPGQDAGGGGDWPAQLADTVVRVVDSVRGKTTGPATTIARAIVYGTLAAIVGIAVLVLAIVAAVRALNLIPGGVWLSYLILGVLFTGGGLLLLGKARKRPVQPA